MLNELLKKLWQNWLRTKRESKFFYLCLASAFFALVCIFFRSNTVLSGTFLLASACFYFAWQNAIKGPLGNAINSSTNSKREFDAYVEEIQGTNHDSQRNIHIEQGNYNESIAGDYINIQGNLINVNQDFPAFVNNLATVVERLSVEQTNFTQLREGIAHDLKASAQHNSKFKRTLNSWKLQLGKKTKISDAEMVTELITKSEETRWNAVNKKVEFGSHIYGNLESYLREGDWKKADSETVEVIIKVLSETFGSKFTTNLEKNRKEVKQGCYRDDINLQGLSAEHIVLIPSIHLRYIDCLWKRYSNGRFGFSIQKQILREVYKDHYYWDDYLDWEDFCYDQPNKFGKRVGWQVDGHWIFITDATFTTSAPTGHLPFQLYTAGSSYSYGYQHRVCSSILKVIAKRLYD